MVQRAERKLGRNEPCWCGSGKKYKNCHLSQDEQAAQRARPQPPAQPAKPAVPSARVGPPELPQPPTLSPEDQAEQAEWEKFDQADLDGKVAFFLERIDNKRMDAQDAVEAYFAIRDETEPRRNAADRARLTELIEHLRREAPAAYRQKSGVYLGDLAQFAIAEERWEALSPLLSEFAEIADKEIEDFFSTIKMLLYHGQTAPVLTAMTAAWPKVSQSDEILPRGVDEFLDILVKLHLYRYLEATPQPRPDDPLLREPIQGLGGTLDEIWLTTAVQHLSATGPSTWSVEDFGGETDAETWERNVSALLFEFMADVKRRAGTPFSRSDFFKDELRRVLHQQISEGEPRPRGKKKKNKHRRSPATTAGSPLLPGYEELDRAFAGKFNILGSEPYEAGALLELLPAYLHWIARLGLIHPTEMDEALTALQPLCAQVLKLLEAFGADIHLLRSVETPWSDAALGARRQDPELSALRAQPMVITPSAPVTVAEAGTYRFKVSYQRAEDVWFLVEMGRDQTLEQLHHAILKAADFDEDHLYAFFLSGRAWDKQTEYGASDARYSSRIRIGDLPLRMKQHFLYLYDFGDEHRFDVQLIATAPERPRGGHPRIVEKHGRMPSQYPDWDEEDEEDGEPLDDEENDDEGEEDAV